MRLLIFLLVFKSCFVCHSQPTGYGMNYTTSIVDLTKDELPVYIALDVKQGDERVGRLLITNLELAWNISSPIESDKVLFDELEQILLKGYVEYRPGVWDDYFIQENHAFTLSQMKLEQVLYLYFYSNGTPKDDINGELLKEVVAHLIRNEIIVHQGNYFDYNIYVSPR